MELLREELSDDTFVGVAEECGLEPPTSLTRRKDNAVFGHRSRGMVALTHRNLIKQCTTLF